MDSCAQLVSQAWGAETVAGLLVSCTAVLLQLQSYWSPGVIPQPWAELLGARGVGDDQGPT